MRYAVYARRSKRRDDALSIESQLASCASYVQTRGTVVLELEDQQSGLDSHRPGYQSLLKAAREHRIDAALVWRWDRWGRDHHEAMRSCVELEALGIVVESMTQSNDPFGRDLELLLANKSSRDTSIRVKPIQKMKASAGWWQGRAPAGYNLVNRKLKPDNQAPLVRELFHLASSGDYSMAQLRRWAHMKGLKGNAGKKGVGKAPSRSLLHKWLTNPVYTGDVIYNRRANGKFEPKRSRPESEWVVCEDAHEALVDRETFAAVQAVLAQHRTFQGDIRGSRWLLTGRIFCGHCGGRMYGRTAGRGHFTYSCQQGLEYNTCSFRSTGGKALDRWIKEQVKSIEIGDDVQAATKKVIRGEAARQIEEFTRQRKDRLSAQKRHQEERHRLARGVMSDIIAPDVYKQMEEQEATALATIERELATMQPPQTPDLAPIMEALSAVSWDSLDDQGWREAVSLLVQQVKVYGLGEYRLVWTETAEALRRVLQTVS